MFRKTPHCSCSSMPNLSDSHDLAQAYPSNFVSEQLNYSVFCIRSLKYWCCILSLEKCYLIFLQIFLVCFYLRIFICLSHLQLLSYTCMYSTLQVFYTFQILYRVSNIVSGLLIIISVPQPYLSYQKQQIFFDKPDKYFIVCIFQHFVIHLFFSHLGSGDSGCNDYGHTHLCI